MDLLGSSLIARTISSCSPSSSVSDWPVIDRACPLEDLVEAHRYVDTPEDQ
jgi:hypothetical protein